MHSVFMSSGKITKETVSQITVFDDDSRLVDLLLNTEKQTIEERYPIIRKMIKTNPSMINRVNRVINDIVIPKLMEMDEIVDSVPKWMKVLEIIKDSGSTFKNHSQKDILVCYNCVRIMAIINS